MSNCISMKTTTPYGVKEVPEWAQKGHICPYRKDYFQCECWRCDLCGRNEDTEHGASFQTVKINGFSLFEEAINTENSRMEDNWYIFQYGKKEIYLDLQYLDKWCEHSMNDIHNMIVSFRKNDTYRMITGYEEDEYDSVENYDGPIFLYLDNKEYGPFCITADSAIIMLIGDYTTPQYKTFVHLLEYMEEMHMSLEDWERIYGDEL